MLVFTGSVMYTVVGLVAGIWFQQVAVVLILSGAVFLVIGLASYPGTRKRVLFRKRILEIAAVEKEVTISDLHVRTGIDSEVVREILVFCLMHGILFGYIEGDLFVRDTSARPVYFRGRTGLIGD
jgi:hypothetical protein